MKKPCREKSIPELGLSVLESLPKVNLNKVISCVDHDDLKKLLRVSNTTKEAILIKQSHFAYSTPSKTQPVLDVGNLSNCRDVEKPKAHRVSRYRPPLDEEKLAAISVNLFHSADDVGNLSDCRDVEKPKAHRVSRYRPPLDEEKLAAISVNLFHSADGPKMTVMMLMHFAILQLLVKLQ